MRAVRVAPVASAADLDAVRALFREYVAARAVDPDFARVLAAQAFDAELAALPGPYAPPAGALLLARVDGEPAGCVACRPWAPPAVCEMKRLYVRPAFRALGLGERLARAVMEAARAAGYERMRLDTLPSMGDAQRLYERLGFREIAPYRDTPAPGARFLEADLAPTRRTHREERDTHPDQRLP